jgi:hypothetical protein
MEYSFQKHTVPINPNDRANGFIAFTIPARSDVVDEITCSPKSLKIYLRGAGTDKIPVDGLSIYLHNAIFSSMVLIVELGAPDHANAAVAAAESSIVISYREYFVSESARKSNGHIAIRRKIKDFC